MIFRVRRKVIFRLSYELNLGFSVFIKTENLNNFRLSF